MSTLAVGVALAAQAFGTPTVEIAPGVDMPIINLGTWSLGMIHRCTLHAPSDPCSPHPCGFRLSEVMHSLGNGKPSDPSIGVPAWLAAGGNGIDCAWVR